MALELNDAVLSNNSDDWKEYKILNDDGSQVYELTMDDDGNIILTKTDDPEDNDVLKDKQTDIEYYLAITVDEVLWLDPLEDTCTMAELCDKIEAVKLAVEALKVNEEKQTEQIIEISNGWKAIV